MSASVQNQQRPGSSMGTNLRSHQQQPLFHPPPPYRAPPTPAGGNVQGHIQQFSPTVSKHTNAATPYSKFNSSEPNVSGNPNVVHQQQQNNNMIHNGFGQPTSPTSIGGGYRHTINHENSQQVQHGLRTMIQQPGAMTKHSTLDSAGQNIALNLLRNSGINAGQLSNGNIVQPIKPSSSSQIQVANGDSTYVSADNLRDAATRLFTRNHGDRSSFGTLTATQQNQQQATAKQQQLLHQHMQRFSSVRGNAATAPITNTTNTNYGNINSTMSPVSTSDEKRHSYANQSFRKALDNQQITNQPNPQPGVPVVPPKPNNSTSRSGSKDGLASDNYPSNDQDTTLDAELKNILRGGTNSANTSFIMNSSGQRLSMGPNGTPPLPALSPGPMPSSLLLQAGFSGQGDQSVSYENTIETSQAVRNNNHFLMQQGNANNNNRTKAYNAQPQKTGGNRPDLLGDAPEAALSSSDKVKSLLGSTNTNSPLRRTNIMENIHLIKDPKTGKVIGGKKLPIPVSNAKGVSGMTPGAIDLEQLIGMVGGTTDVTSEDYEEDGASTMIDVGDAQAIRRQLDGLENMYTEVLRLLGLRKFGRHYHEPPGGISVSTNNPNGSKGHHIRRNKMYGSMSSLPSVSSIGSRHLYKDKQHQSHQRKDVSTSASKRPGSAGGNSREKNYNKRFQRLESHVVTLARSVANLSSEMRSQQILLQEVDALRAEIHQIRMTQSTSTVPARNLPQLNQSSHPHFQPGDLFGGHGGRGVAASNGIKPSGVFTSIHANRVRKLTKFFGEEPPLVKQFLKHLGYEKYAAVFEEAKIGMLELPYLTEERLEKLGVPTGPRLRIVQEAKSSVHGVKQIPLGSPGNPNATSRIPPTFHSAMGQPHGTAQQHNNNHSAAATVGGGVSSNPHEPNYNVYIL